LIHRFAFDAATAAILASIARNDNPNYDYYYCELEMQHLMRPQSEDFDFPGVTPSRQQRSRETTAALLQAGADMLRTRSLAELSIEALCSKVGATVGAFYSRFESKEAYFNALIELAARDGQAVLSRMAQNEQLERFQAKWKPVRVKKTRQIKNLEPRFDSIETGL